LDQVLNAHPHLNIIVFQQDSRVCQARVLEIVRVQFQFKAWEQLCLFLGLRGLGSIVFQFLILGLWGFVFVFNIFIYETIFKEIFIIYC